MTRRVILITCITAISAVLFYIQPNPAAAATFDSNLIPGGTGALNIGLTASRLQHVYISGNLNIGGSLLIGNLAGDPAGANGMLYYNTTTKSLRGYQNNSWAELGHWNFDVITNNLYNSNSGNVGIGTTAPAYKLDLNGTVQMTGFKLPTGAGKDYVLTATTSGQGYWKLWDVGDANWFKLNNNIYNTNTANVGVGTSSPQAKLHVYKGTLKTDNEANFNNVKIGNLKVKNATTTGDLTVGNNIYSQDVISAGTGGISANEEISTASYLKIGKINAGAPADADCDDDNERGLMAIDNQSYRLYLCGGASRGWDYINLNN